MESSFHPTYKIDLLKTKGTGEIHCPKCGTVLSPEDWSNKDYKILETEVVDDTLQVTIKCNICGSNILLFGPLL